MSTEIVVSDPLGTALKAQRLLFTRKLPPVGLLLMLIWAAAAALLALRAGSPWAGFALALAALATLLPPVAYLSARRLLKKAFRSVPGGAYTYAVDEQGVSWRSPIGGSQVNWAGFTAVYPSPSLWVLLIAQRQFVALPADQLDEATRELILSKVKGARGKAG